MTTIAGGSHLRVEVAYARPEEQLVLPLEVPSGATVRDAIRESGIIERFPEIDLDCQQVGIFSKPVGLGHMLRDGDRVEIYRPLQADPKEMRRKRARSAK